MRPPSRSLPSPAPRRRRAHRGDEGQVTVLVVGFALIALLLVTVVVNASKVFLVHRSLSAAADGAAVAGADALDQPAFYARRGSEPPGTLPLSSAAVSAAVGDYAATAGLPGRFDGFGATSAVAADGTTVSVTATAVVPLPFLNLVSDRYAGGVPLTVTASARSPLLP